MAHPELLECAQKQIEAARTYTLGLLDGLDENLWFVQPDGCPSHVAWQVGHLAATQYLLVVFRLRGKKDEDSRIISKDFLRRFGKGSRPEPQSAVELTPAELRQVLDGVHQMTREVLETVRPEELDERVREPFAAYDTKLGSLLFCAHHEMLHAGQIGLIRRMLGFSPVR